MTEQGIFDLKYLPLKISMISLERAELPPYLGSTLRGVIGQSLYRIDREAYDFLYKNGGKCGNQQDIVKPYIIIPPEFHGDRYIVARGEELVFEFLLLGDAIKYASSLALALQNIGQYGLGAQRYPFSLLRIVNREEQRILWRRNIYYKTGENEIRIPCHRLQNVTGAEIELRTPLRIRRNGQLLTEIHFQTLIRNITSRMSAITERYGGEVDRDEAERLVMLAGEVRTVREDLRVLHLERYSNRVKDKMDFSGLMGRLEYEGELTPFVPWLSAAQILHIGRNTTFGMGKIEVQFLG